MTLKNLLGISLEEVATNKASMRMLLASAERNIADAQLQGLGTENQFDAAYKAIMQTAMVALNASGYRTLKSKPGHHQTAIQTLSLTIGLPTRIVIILDALRKQRNLSDYSGDLVSEAAAKECLVSAKDLLLNVRTWLRTNEPELLK